MGLFGSYRVQGQDSGAAWEGAVVNKERACTSKGVSRPFACGAVKCFRKVGILRKLSKERGLPRRTRLDVTCTGLRGSNGLRVLHFCSGSGFLALRVKFRPRPNLAKRRHRICRVRRCRHSGFSSHRPHFFATRSVGGCNGCLAMRKRLG